MLGWQIFVYFKEVENIANVFKHALRVCRVEINGHCERHNIKNIALLAFTVSFQVEKQFILRGQGLMALDVVK